MKDFIVVKFSKLLSLWIKIFLNTLCGKQLSVTVLITNTPKTIKLGLFKTTCTQPKTQNPIISNKTHLVKIFFLKKPALLILNPDPDHNYFT